MKKLILTTMFISMMLVITACGGTSNQQTGQGNTNNATTAELPLASKLALGSFKLEKTDHAITAEEAADLLPLWQVYQQLSVSDTAAQEEITGLVEQIQEAMTADQTKAIDAMGLTQRDIFTTMQEQGIQFGNGRQQATTNGQENTTRSNNSNNFPAPGGGGGDFFVRPANGGNPSNFGGQGFSPQQVATAQARRTANGGNSFRLNVVPTPLVEALVKLLQQKTDS